MLWFIFALISALGQSGIEVLSKKTLRTTDQLTISFSIVFFAIPFTLPILLLGFFPSEINFTFWLVLLGSTFCTVLVLHLLIKSIEYSDLSKSIPMFAFTPVFLLFTSPLILREFPSLLGILGTTLIVLGVYFLHFQKSKKIFLPFKSLWTERGPIFALVASFVIGIGANFDRIGIENTNPVFWIVSINLSSSFVLGFFVLSKNKHQFKHISFPLKSLFVIGGLTAITQISLMYSFTLTLVPYAIAIKRTNILFSSIMGFLMFREKISTIKLASILVMIIGMIVVLIGN